MDAVPVGRDLVAVFDECLLAGVVGCWNSVDDVCQKGKKRGKRHTCAALAMRNNQR